MEIQASEHAFLKKPHRTIIGLSIPVTLSLIAEPITGLVDTAFVSRLGAEPLAALGVGTTALSSMFWIFNFLSISAQTEVAKALGAKNRARAAEITSLALILGLFFSLLVILIFTPGAVALSSLLGAEGQVQADAVTYLRIRLLGAPAVLVTLIGFGVLRGLQDMQRPMWIAGGINLLNIIMDGPFIFGLGVIPALGVGGSALASTIAQWIGAAFVLYSLHRRLGLIWHINRADVSNLMRVGGDLFLRTGLLTVFLLLTTRVANQISAEAGAAHQAIRTVWMLTALLLDGLAVTIQSLVGYFVGASQTVTARSAARLTALWSLGLGLALAVIMLAATDLVLVGLVPTEAAAIFMTAWAIASLTQPFNALAFVTDGIHWGTSDYTFLRNAMLFSTAVAAGIVLLIDTTSQSAFTLLWIATGIWILLRTILGVMRVWPGIGDSPLRPRSVEV